MSRDDDYDRPAAAPGGMDGFLSNMVAVVILALVSFFCCPLIGLILGIIGMITCKTSVAKKNATILLVVSVLSIALNIILNATGVVNFNQQMQGFGK
jgi:hypothetical protein